MDPLETLTGERYGYASNDPINNTDPTGLDFRESVHFLSEEVGKWTCRIFTNKDKCADTGRINAARHFLGSALTAWTFVELLGPHAGSVATQGLLQYHELDGCMSGVKGNGPWRVRDAIADQANNAVGMSVGTLLGSADVSLDMSISILTSTVKTFVRYHVLDLGGGFSE